MKKSLVLFFFWGLIFTLQGQENISGKILDTQQQPLEFANVLLFKNSDSTFVKGALTDQNGIFKFKIENSDYYLNVTLIGYENYFSNTFQIIDNQLIKLPNIILNEDSKTLEEVTVTAKKPMFEQQIDRMVVNVQNSITATGASALEILNRSPGIDIDPLNNQISMQGKEGVFVLLNGKRTRIDGNGLIQFLRGMPSNNIEKIELITAPPASFDAEGDAGIINIVTVQKGTEGANGSLSLNAGYGQRPKLGGSFNFNFRKNDWNLFLDLSSSVDYSQENVTLFRTNVFENTVTENRVFSDRPATTGLHSGRFGLDYQISEKSTIGALFSGYLRTWDLDANTETKISDNFGNQSLSKFEAIEENDWSHWLANLNFRHQFENDATLSFDIDILKYLDENPTSYFQELFDENGTLISNSTLNSNKKTPINFQVIKLDYQKKWSEKLSSEIGLKGTNSTFTNNIRVENLVNGEMIPDPRFTDIFDLEEQIGAAYLSLDYQFSAKISTKAGIRYEYYDSHLGSENEGALVVQKFGRFFPTFFMTYQINENNQWQFSYNERIRRPSLNDIAPAFFFWDNNTILGGNPAVRPTISRRVSTNFRHKKLLLTLQFTDDDNPLARQPIVIPEENLLLTRAENLADLKIGMASINLPIQFTDWWESRYNLSAFWVRTQPKVEGKIVTRKNKFLYFTFAQNFTLPKKFSLEWTGSLRSTRIYGLGEVPFRGSFNLGLQKSFNKNTKLSLSWNDLFNWGSFWEINYNQPDFNILYDWHYETEGNVVRLNFSWQFGNTKLKKNNRQTGSEEERRRVN